MPKRLCVAQQVLTSVEQMPRNSKGMHGEINDKELTSARVFCGMNAEQNVFQS